MPRALICLSHLRWDFVYQRPNHLMARAADDFDVWFVEEAVADADEPRLELVPVEGVTVVRPHVPSALSTDAADAAVARLLARLADDHDLESPVLWYYTPLALTWTTGLRASVTVYDCMDQLAAFRGASPRLVEMEARLLRTADLVFTGGRQLFEAKRYLHPSVHCFPSSVDRAHFAAARRPQPDPSDQAPIGRPRVGYFGVIDERLDLELVGEVARRRPDWQLVLVGPVAKIDPADIPSLPNVHPLGRKSYAQLPAYLAGWDVAMMPFARNEATQYISPTKTPEYLAGGRPVVSTSIADVVEPYGRERLARIADTPPAFEAAIAAALTEDGARRQARADAFLARGSWDATWSGMATLIGDVLAGRRRAAGAAALPTGPAMDVPAAAFLARPAPIVAARGTAGRLASATGLGMATPVRAARGGRGR